MLVLEGWGELVENGSEPGIPCEDCHDVLEPAGWHSTVRVRIVRPGVGRIDGISLAHYHLGQSYEVPSVLATYLVIEGYAIVEMRQKPRFSSPVPRMRSITLHRPLRFR